MGYNWLFRNEAESSTDVTNIQLQPMQQNDTFILRGPQTLTEDVLIYAYYTNPSNIKIINAILGHNQWKIQNKKK